MSSSVSPDSAHRASGRSTAEPAVGRRTAVLTVSPSGEVRAADAVLARWLDRPLHDLVGSPVSGLLDGESRSAVTDALSSVQADPTAAGEARLALRTAAGAVTPVHASWSALHAAGDVLLVLVCRKAVPDSSLSSSDLFGRLSQEVVVVGDAQGTVLYVSPAVRSLFGYDVQDVVTCDLWEFVHPDDQAAARAAYAEVARSSSARTARLRVRAADGAWRWVEQTAANLTDTLLGGIVCTLRDITAQVEADQALRASEARFRAIAETAEEGIWAISTTGETLYANARLQSILGLGADSEVALADLEHMDPNAAAEIAARLATEEHREAERYEISYRHPDGRTRRLWISTSTLTADQGALLGSLAMVSDVTEMRTAEAELRESALRDGLTKLPNRALLLDRLNRAVERTPACTAVVFVGLDGFRMINDVHGHAAGDQLLAAVAERLVEAVRPHDTVARFGGDEFVVVCEDTPGVQARELARSMLEAISEPFTLGGTRLQVSASLGIAATDPASGAISAADLMRCADTAMRSAKAGGRGRVRLFDQALAQDVEQRHALASDLRAGLAEDQLTLAYQPIVDLRSGRVVGAEALSRWTHPVRGVVPPTTFVMVAEMTGLEVDLDRWVLQRALREFAALRSSGAVPEDGFVSVNISAGSLTDSRLSSDIADWVAAAGLTPSHVVLEITETAIMQDTDSALELLRRLRDSGFRIAIDDFGTGYSSLAYLRDLPVTTLKIDRSFIADIPTSRDALAIVASIIDLARAVGVGVVAEGVETPEQSAVLQRLGCASAQGWLWSPAVLPGDIAPGQWQQSLMSPATGDAAAVPAVTEPALPPEVLERILQLHHDGASLITIAAALNAEGLRTPTGLRWSRKAVARAVADAAYPSLQRLARPGTAREGDGG